MTVRGECLYCKADTGPKPGEPYVMDDGTIFDKTSDVCEKCKPTIERQIQEVKAGGDVIVGSPPPANSMVENNRELLEKFCGPLIDPSQPEATVEDLKVLFVRASKIIWPDKKAGCRSTFCKNVAHSHPKFTSADGKAYIKGMYRIESTKELRRPQVGFVLAEFGKVLSSAAYFERDEKGIPYIVVMSGVSLKKIEGEKQKP